VEKGVTLAERLKEIGANEAIIGLKFITEFLEKKKAPLYECSLCKTTKINALEIGNHIVGYQHRRNYFKELAVAGLDVIPVMATTVSRKEASKKASAIEMIHGRGEWRVEKIEPEVVELDPVTKDKNKQFCLSMLSHIVSESFEIENDEESILVSKIVKKMTNALVNYKFGGSDEVEEVEKENEKACENQMETEEVTMETEQAKIGEDEAEKEQSDNIATETPSAEGDQSYIN